MDNYTFYILNTDNNTIINGSDSYDKALETVDCLQEEAFNKGDRRIGVYRIVDKDNIPVHRYMVKSTHDDGSYEYIDVITVNENYTPEDYINQHPGASGVITLEMRTL